MKSKKQDLCFFDSIFLSTKKDNKDQIMNLQSQVHQKLLPTIRTITDFFQPVNYKIYEKFRRKQKYKVIESINRLKIQDIRKLNLNRQIAIQSESNTDQKYQSKSINVFQMQKCKSKNTKQHQKIINEYNQTKYAMQFICCQNKNKINGHPIVTHPLNFSKKMLPMKKKTVYQDVLQKEVIKSSRQKLKQKRVLPQFKESMKSLKKIQSKVNPQSLSVLQKVAKQQKPLVNLQKNELSKIKAQSFVVVEYPSMKLISGNKYKNNAQIASLTKIMTFYTVYRILENNLDYSLRSVCKIDQEAGQMSGTTAELITGDQISVQDLLYGLMLPSGNDAALALAKSLGSSISRDQDRGLQSYNRFIIAMNVYAKEIGMKSSIFVNPHGLPNNKGSSNPYELAILIGQCLKIPLFCKIVSTKAHSTWISNEGVRRELLWQNTNKLLRRKGFIGVKTGVTVTAGPCLATCYEKQNKKFIIVLLRTNKLSRRFKQTRMILGFSLKKYDNQYLSDYRQIMKNDVVQDSDNSEDQQQFNYLRVDAAQYQKRNKILLNQL